MGFNWCPSLFYKIKRGIYMNSNFKDQNKNKINNVLNDRPEKPFKLIRNKKSNECFSEQEILNLMGVNRPVYRKRKGRFIKKN